MSGYEHRTYLGQRKQEMMKVGQPSWQLKKKRENALGQEWKLGFGGAGGGQGRNGETTV